MEQQSAGASRRALRCARRSLVLAAVGAGLWLAGEATASAQELTPPLATLGATSSDVTDAAAPREEPPAPATSTTDLGETLAGPTGATAAAAAPAAVAPVVPEAAPVVHSGTVPVADLADPVVRSAEVVLEAAAPLRDVAAELAGPLAGAPDRLLGPAGVVVDPVLGVGPIGSQESLDAGLHSLPGGVHGGAEDTAGAAHGIAPADAVVRPGAGQGRAAGGSVPVGPPTPATGAPSPARCTGAPSSDQSPADVPAAGGAVITAALAAAGDARDAARNRASEPSFSPD